MILPAPAHRAPVPLRQETLFAPGCSVPGAGPIPEAGAASWVASRSHFCVSRVASASKRSISALSSGWHASCCEMRRRTSGESEIRRTCRRAAVIAATSGFSNRQPDVSNRSIATGNRMHALVVHTHRHPSPSGNILSCDRNSPVCIIVMTCDSWFALEKPIHENP